MGKRAPTARAEAKAKASVEAFVQALNRQLADKHRSVRVFDVGGTGVKTGLFSAAMLREFLRPWKSPDEGVADPVPASDDQPEELEWIEGPTLLGKAPGEDGFAQWLQETVPRLRREVADEHVVFGVSTSGDLDHSSGILNDWWCGGGHPREWGPERKSPLLADLMGLPRGRTFAMHDGEAHLLGCSRCLAPPPGLACFSVGTGVGFGLTDTSGAVVEPQSEAGTRSLALGGVPLSGARYDGIWRRWLEGSGPGLDDARVQEVMAKDFANMSRPWRIPWTSLVLGRRGMELAEASHRCPPPGDVEAVASEEALAGGGKVTANVEEEWRQRTPAVQAYAEQWLHFLHSEFAPQFASATRRHPVERICFAGRVAETNWNMLREVLADPETSRLRPRVVPGTAGEGTSGGEAMAGRGTRKSKAARPRGSQLAAIATTPPISILPLAPRGSGLIGAGIYALAGMGGAAMAVWTV